MRRKYNALLQQGKPAMKRGGIAMPCGEVIYVDEMF
jgi:hypothetical protein